MNKNEPFMYLIKGTHLDHAIIPHGWGNGYVAVSPTHPWYGKHCDDIAVNVHGGLTYSEQLGDYWVVGFDTCHFNDTLERFPVEAVVAETKLLLEQALKAM